MSHRSYANSSSSSIHSHNNFPHQRSPSTRTAPLPNDPQQSSKWSIQVSRKISSPNSPKFVLPPQPSQPLAFPDPDRCLIEAGYQLPPYSQDPFQARLKNSVQNKPNFTPPPVINKNQYIPSQNGTHSFSPTAAHNPNLLPVPNLPSTLTVSPIHTPLENPLSNHGSLIRRKTQSLIEIQNRATVLTNALSTILTEFFKTAQEVMNGTQILNSLETICGIPKHRRDLTLAVSESILPYGYIKHVSDDTFPVFDGEDEWYTVKPPPPNSEWPQGVLTYLAPCYFPTCCSERPCGSYSCPTQIGNIIPDPQGKLSLTIQTQNDDNINILRRTRSHTNPQSPSVASHVTLTPSQHDIRAVAAQYNPEQPLLWSQTVPPEILSTVEPTERKRQEAIFETIINEMAYINDLRLIDEIYVNPLRRSGIFNENRIDSVIATLFSNYKQILKQNESMMEKFLLRQQDAYIVPFIGDLMIPWAKDLTCYSIYASNMLYAHHFFTNEAKFNPKFNQFLTEAAEHPKSRKLPIKHFIERPTGKLARYALLLKEILKRTPEDSMDATWLPQVVEMVKKEMDQVDKVTGEVQLKLQLDSITSRLYFKKEDESPYLQLDSEHRKLIKQGPMTRHQGGSGSNSVVVFLFDNALVVAKEKNNTVVEYRGVGPAIPLYLLRLDEDNSIRISSSYTAKTIKHHVESASSTTEQGKALNIYFYGKYYGSHHLVAMNPRMRQQWADSIYKTISESPIVSCDVIQPLDLTPPSRPTNKPLHTTTIYVDPSSGANMILTGSDDGLYAFDSEGNSRRVLWTSHKIQQVEVVSKYHLVLVLTGDKYLHAYSTDMLKFNVSGKKDTQATKIGENVSFFKVGTCGNRDLVVSSKFHDLKSFFKAMELVSGTKSGSLSKGISQGKVLWQSKHATGLRLAKKFYVGTQAYSITFLKSKMAIACGPGFEIVDLDALFLNHGIPDPQDPFFLTNVHFASRLEQATPLAIKRINPYEFLLCYKEFGLFVNNEGKCSRPKSPFIEWEGIPYQFCFVSNYVVAVDPNFLEVRNLQTGQLVQVILEPGIRCTHPGSGTHITMFVKPTIHQNMWSVQTIKMSNPLPDLAHF